MRLTYGKSQSEKRYSPLKQIDTSNGKRLGLEWSYVVGAGGYKQEGTPLIWNDPIYGTTTGSVVYAVDARAGIPQMPRRFRERGYAWSYMDFATGR